MEMMPPDCMGGMTGPMMAHMPPPVMNAITPDQMVNMPPEVAGMMPDDGGWQLWASPRSSACRRASSNGPNG